MKQFDRIGTWCNKCNNVMCICQQDTLPEKPFYVHNVRSVLNELNREEISFTKMVEKLNEIAFEFYDKNKNTLQG